MKELPVHSLSLYRQTLGADFESLPDVLRHFHESPSAATASGILHISRGQGWARRTLATLMRLPSPGENVPAHLHVQVDKHGERWIRRFGSLRLVTWQYYQKGLLIETAGPLRFGFHVTADAAGMQFETVRCWFLSLPLPLFLAPRVFAQVTGKGASWWIDVRIEVPVLGILTHYEGEVTPQC